MRKTVIVPGFNQTSLGTIRCLARSDVDIWLVGSKDDIGPAYYSSIPARKIVLKVGAKLTACLCALGRIFSDKPALLLTEDRHVVEIACNINLIKKYYRCLLPPARLVDLLMDKAKFTVLAKNHSYRIPKTKIVGSKEELYSVAKDFSFPFMLKPYLLHSRKINSQSDLTDYLFSFSEINYKSMVIQEWIPGADDQIYFCFLFFDEGSDLRAAFVARKLRQYPQQYGTTSYCVSVDNDEVLSQSLKIFSELNYSGFCSVEYKYDQRSNEYVIMEPTVGRFNQQVALTQAAGVNFPSIILEYLYGAATNDKRQADNKYWIYETNDFFSTFQSFDLLSFLSSCARANARVLFSSKDPFPFFAEIFNIISQGMIKAFKHK